jgi:hypothetical protein
VDFCKESVRLLLAIVGRQPAYIHRNPVSRELVESAEDWKWSGFRHYALREDSGVEIESQWTAEKNECGRASASGVFQTKADVGHPPASLHSRTEACGGEVEAEQERDGGVEVEVCCW